ncbi:DUF1476 domain-containing protein [Telmatospirillum siberiense]|uniref:DUF1476 domain-containing protein n=1 Tax=Telmatospirillum siberiense TaxID=382514 RepID=A0A2N3Q186_9PROT|nr:DUF1476 domain-containing protein [Telmatospirillum siberiense]PKU26412.1 DUF1476 domain-containing protein [Telmatospirillum siberiense]
MGGFDEREKAFEAKYHLDEELAFKIGVRRAKLLGLWVAEQLGLSGEAGVVYARKAVEADLGDSAHVGLLAKLRTDLLAGGKDAAVGRLADEFHRLEAEARGQIVAEVTAGKQAIPPE